MMNRWKQKYTAKSVKEKTNATNNLKTGMSNKDVSKKYRASENTSSTWVKSKEKILKVYKSGHTKRQRLKIAERENINAATYKRFLSKRCENVSITGLIAQTQALKLAKKLNIADFHTLDGWLGNCKEK